VGVERDDIADLVTQPESGSARVSRLPNGRRRPCTQQVLLSCAVLIPLLTSSLRGLPHRLSCTSAWTPDFEVAADGQRNPVVSSALVVTRETQTEPDSCARFRFDAQVQPTAPRTLSATLRLVSTATESTWATAEVQLGDDVSFLTFGPIESGQTIEKVVKVNVPVGQRILRARVRLGG
jgi:hypothetical protein